MTELAEEKCQHYSNEEVGLYNDFFLRFLANSMLSPRCEALCILHELPLDSGELFPAIGQNFQVLCMECVCSICSIFYLIIKFATTYI
jgi:hypothetical protein